jgi:hypothetical protein
LQTVETSTPMRPTTLRVSSAVLLRWIRDHSGDDFKPSMVVIANDWTTKIVWAQLNTLLSCPPFWDGPERPPSQALIQRRPGLSFVAYFPVTYPSPMDGSVRRYGLTAMGRYYLEALENPDAAHGPYMLMALKHPEIESAEALAIYDAVPVLKKLLGWLNVLGVHLSLRKQWLRHHVGAIAEHLVYGIILDGIFYTITKHEAAWWVIQTVFHLKTGHE